MWLDSQRLGHILYQKIEGEAPCDKSLLRGWVPSDIAALDTCVYGNLVTVRTRKYAE
jgi:hypothetical protein